MPREPHETPSAIDAAAAEVADWLARNPSIKDQAGAIAGIVGEQAVRVLSEYGRVTTRHALTLCHFLCGVLADIARAIDEFKQQLDKVPDRVISLILGRGGDSVLSDIAMRVIIRSSWRLINEPPIFGQADTLLRTVRIAAILICPAPEKHAEVARFCLYPLAGEVISAATLQRLKEVLPQE
jgi:hypothetical protein